ncbi:MAG: hypothetical protein ACKO96_26715 [Flammeovirgaceae bacterium]
MLSNIGALLDTAQALARTIATLLANEGALAYAEGTNAPTARPWSAPTSARLTKLSAET